MPHATCAGLDVYQDLVVACARIQQGARVRREQRRFDTTTKGLLDLLAWLTEIECMHVAMEATGVYCTLGTSGRRIVEAIAAGENDPDKLAALGSERLRCSHSQLCESLRGRVTARHRSLLRQHLDTIDHLQRVVDQFDAQIARRLEPFGAQHEFLMTIPGVRETAAACILAEVGADMSRFPSAAHLVSWAGLCPRMDESAGKRRSTRLRKGAPWLKPVLVPCAWGAARTKRTYTQAQFLRLKARRGPMKAVVAVAATMLTAAYYILRDGASYRELGPDHVVERDRTRVAERLARRIRELGDEVTIKQAA